MYKLRTDLIGFLLKDTRVWNKLKQTKKQLMLEVGVLCESNQTQIMKYTHIHTPTHTPHGGYSLITIRTQINILLLIVRNLNVPLF